LPAIVFASAWDVVPRDVRAPPSENRYDLDRFGNDTEPTATVSPSAASDHDVHDFNEALAGELKHGGEAAPGAAVSSTMPIATLSSTPLEVAEPADAQRRKRYHGQYYPVEDVEHEG
jgi:hypothetical protein